MAYEASCVQDVELNHYHLCVYCKFLPRAEDARIIHQCRCFIYAECATYIPTCPSHPDALIRTSTLEIPSEDICQVISNLNVRCMFHAVGCTWSGRLIEWDAHFEGDCEVIGGPFSGAEFQFMVDLKANFNTMLEARGLIFNTKLGFGERSGGGQKIFRVKHTLDSVEVTTIAK